MTDPAAAELFQKRVRVGLRQVQSKKLASARVLDCLIDAYDVYANASYEAGEQLTDELLTQRIPALVHDAAVKFKWVPHPSFRHRGRGAVVGSFLRGTYNPARYEPIPQAELTEIFGGYKVRNGYAAAFIQIIEGRVLHWQAVANPGAVAPDSPQPQCAGDTLPMISAKEAPGAYADTGSDRRAMVEGYIEEVFRKTGKRITRTDIWRAGGDKTRAEFERWESCWYEKHGKKTNKAAQRRFTHLLMTKKPHLR